jgi:hypothetical protein
MAFANLARMASTDGFCAPPRCGTFFGLAGAGVPLPSAFPASTGAKVGSP